MRAILASAFVIVLAVVAAPAVPDAARDKLADAATKPDTASEGLPSASARRDTASELLVAASSTKYEEKMRGLEGIVDNVPVILASDARRQLWKVLSKRYESPQGGHDIAGDAAVRAKVLAAVTKEEGVRRAERVTVLSRLAAAEEEGLSVRETAMAALSKEQPTPESVACLVIIAGYSDVEVLRGDAAKSLRVFSWGIVDPSREILRDARSGIARAKLLSVVRAACGADIEDAVGR